MAFWRLDHPDGLLAIIEGASGEVVSYGELRRRVAACADRLRARPRLLIFLSAQNTADAVVAYLAALEAEAAIALLNPEIPPDRFDRLIGAKIDVTIPR